MFLWDGCFLDSSDRICTLLGAEGTKMNTPEYWAECIAIAAEECDLTLTPEHDQSAMFCATLAGTW